jgi:hypothetical protein
VLLLWVAVAGGVFFRYCTPRHQGLSKNDIQLAAAMDGFAGDR